MRCLAWIALVCAACGDNGVSDDRLGGDTTVDDRTSSAFTHPLATLDLDGQNRHHTGSGPFDFHWEVPQLGPLFNHDGCISCHAANGRGQSQIGPDPFGSQALVRCSMPSGTPEVPGGQAPVPGLGTQLQDHAINGPLPEVNVTLTWTQHDVAYDDGTTESLRAPSIAIMRADSSVFPPDALISYRQALPVIGIGLLDAIDAADILANAHTPGGGHPNLVWNPITQAMQLGRFGHKASQPTAELQSAGAFANDVGLSSRIFPDPDGNLDVANTQLDDTVYFVRTIAVPAAATRDSVAWRGSELFESFTCTSCHVKTFVTGDSDIPELAHQLIHPYTDLLLHDLGDGLADHRPDFLASGSEWRTPPLWGVGLAQVVSPEVTFLHDGRARTLAEAILWHGGEAMPAREAFRTAKVADRVALVAFLSTL